MSLSARRSLLVTVGFAVLTLMLALLAPAHPALAADVARISGVVTVQGGSAVVGVDVVAMDPGSSTVRFGPVQTDESGSFSLTVDPGTYDIHFTPPSGSGFVPFSQLNFAVMTDQSLNVVLTPGVAPPVYRVVSGTVRDANGVPVSSVTVSVGSGAGDRSTTDAAGHYSISVVAGHYGLTVSAPTSSSFGPTWSVGPTPSIDLSSSDVVQDLRLPPSVTLTVDIKDANGNPVGVSILFGRGSGTATLLAGDPATVGTTQLVGGGPAGGSNTYTVLDGLSFSGNTTQNNICVLYVGQVYCASPFTIHGNTTILIQFQPPAPGVPGQPAATTPTNAAPALHWSPSAGATTYRVLRDGQEVGTTTLPEYVDTTLSASGMYAYSIVAVNTSGATSAASAATTVTYDVDPATITPTLAPAANGQGWSNSDVTLTFLCQDDLSGVVSCPEPVTVADEVSGQIISRTIYDRAGNATTVSATINLDRTAPQLGTPAWTASPVPVGSNTTLSVPATDTRSGVLGGEFFVDADPGVGHGTPMSVSGGSITATFGAGLPIGSHTVGVRAVDAAGNWSPAIASTLAVHDPVVADLAVTTSATPNPASLGNTYTFALTVTNHGPQPATSVTTTTGFTGAARQVFGAIASQGTCTIGATLVCDLGTLPSGGTATVSVTVEPQATGSVTASSSVSTTQSDPQSANNTAVTTTTVNNSLGCTIVGTPGNDTITGTNGNDVICALGGDDTVTGGNGDDTIYGGSGNDNLDGGNGNDTIYGGDGNSVLSGGNGNDTITGGDGTDIIHGGNGNDTINAGAGNDTITGDNGNDTINAGTGDDTVDGGNGNDTCTATEHPTSCTT